MAALQECHRPADNAAVAEVEAYRAQAYALLGRLLAAAPDAALLRALAALPQDEATAFGQALAAVAKAAADETADGVDTEFHALFIGLGQGELLPYGSYYLTGFLNEKPLAALRGDMARLGIERHPDRCEPEDHFAFLCDMMAGLITGAFGAVSGLDEQRRFFAAHLDPWADRFLADLEAAPSARFYRVVAALARTVIDIERQGFSLA